MTICRCLATFGTKTINRRQLKHQIHSDKEETLIDKIKRGDDATLNAVYRNFRGEFLVWAARRFNMQEDDAADIFQDAVIVLYRNIAKGHLTELQSSLKTYLFGIGKNLLLKKVTSNVKIVPTDNIDDTLLDTLDLTLLQNDELDHRQQVLKQVVDKLTGVCREIITLFYYRRFSMEAIKIQMGYNSEEVARSMKKKCMTQLTQIVKEQLGDQLF